MSSHVETFRKDGFAMFPQVVPKDYCEAAVAAIAAFAGVHPNDSSTWHKAAVNDYGMINLCHAQSLWDNRQFPSVHAAFAEILGTSRLWVTMDRCGFKPPRDPSHPNYQFKTFMHWDLDPMDLPQELQVQGALYLRDTDANMGGFHCVQGFHEVLQSWSDGCKRGPVPDFSNHQPVVIEGKAGDLLIWDNRLPHGSGENRSSHIRFAQYISMKRASTDPNQRINRIKRFEEQRPTGNRLDRPIFEQNQGRPVRLTPLGRKLVGYDSWA